MICKRCGVQVGDGDLYCFACGTALSSQAAEQHPASPFPASSKDKNLKKEIRKAKKAMTPEKASELNALINHYDIAKFNYDSAVQNYQNRVDQANQALRTALQQYQNNINNAGANLNNVQGYMSAKLSKFGSCILYRNRISTKKATFPLDSLREVRVEITGSVYESVDVQHSARPTLTRVAVGGLVAGPLGAVVGGAAQKHKTTTTHEVHDDRKVVLTVLSSFGSSSEVFDYPKEYAVREFADEIRTAAANYAIEKQANEVEAERARQNLIKTREFTYHIDQARMSVTAAQNDMAEIRATAYDLSQIKTAIQNFIHAPQSQQ